MNTTQIKYITSLVKEVMDLYHIDGRVDYDSRGRYTSVVIEDYGILHNNEPVAYQPRRLDDFMAELEVVVEEYLGEFSYLVPHVMLDGDDIFIDITDH